jgi:hypothetical protein
VQAITEAFDRADAAIEVWQLNTVPEEGEEEEEEEEESDHEPDGTFLTGGSVCVGRGGEVKVCVYVFVWVGVCGCVYLYVCVGVFVCVCVCGWVGGWVGVVLTKCFCVCGGALI